MAQCVRCHGGDFVFASGVQPRRRHLVLTAGLPPWPSRKYRAAALVLGRWGGIQRARAVSPALNSRRGAVFRLLHHQKGEWQWQRRQRRVPMTAFIYGTCSDR